MQSRSRSQYLGYSTAVVAPVLIGLFMAASWPLFAGRPFLPYLLAVVGSAWLGGLFPGLVSLAISLIISNYFFIEPYYDLGLPRLADVTTMIVMTVVGVFLSFVCESLLRGKRRAVEIRQTVEQSEARLSGIIDSAMDAIVTIDSGQKIVLFNAAAETMFKCTAADAIGQSIERFIPERFRGAHGGHVMTFGETQVTTRSMRSLGGIFGIRTNGEEFPIEASISQLETNGEKFFTVILRDITERNQAEQASALERERLTEAQRIGKMGDWDFDLVTGSIAWSAQTFEILGRDPDLGPPSFEENRAMYEPESAVLMSEKVEAAIATGENQEYELVALRPGGERVSLQARAVPRKDETGKVVALYGTVQDITEQKKAAEELQRSEASLANAQRIARIGNWDRVIATGELAWSAEIYEIFGIKLGEFGGTYEDFVATVHPEDRARLDAAQRAALAGEERLDLEHRIVRPDGTERVVHELADLTLDAAGQPTHLAGTVQDITESKQAEAAQRGSDGRLRRMVESNMQGVIFWNTSGAITGANDAFLAFTGYTRSDLEAGLVNWSAMTPPEYADVDQYALNELAATGICTPFEKEYIRKDGSRVPILLGAANFEDSPDEGVCFVIDISERKQAEAAVRASEAEARDVANRQIAILNALPAHIALVDQEGVIILVNEAWRRFATANVLRSEDFSVGQNYISVCEQATGDCSIEAEDVALGIRDVLSGRQMEFAIEYPCHSPQEERWFRLMVTPVHPDLQHGAVVMHLNITDRKLAEDQIHKLNAELEQRVLDRTEQLEAANKELESFSYSVSHDLRAPLRHIDGFVQLLTKREAERLDETSGRYLKIVSDAVLRMGTLIDELLAFSRTNRVEINTARVDPNTLIDQAKTDLAPELAGRKIKWTIDDLPPVEGDTVLLGVVMTNLLSNAIKYTRRRDVAHIEIGMSGETESEVTIFVRDDGAGFDMKYVGKLFGVFQRLHREDEFEGIGIGLATVQRIIHRHGGKIWPESELDKGTTFYLTLKKTKGKTK